MMLQIRTLRWIAAVTFACLIGGRTHAQAASPDPFAPGVVASQSQMTSGAVTSEQLVQADLARIETLRLQGVQLNAIVALNPHALEDARRLDLERKSGRIRGPLHGVPILIKDNVESDDGTATTAGSVALKDNISRRDAVLVTRLKAAGAVILGKANLSEWANIRSTRSISGWSGVGGLVHNPYALDRSACGSSSGSAAAVAAGLVAAAIGTETDGSIMCPASVTGLVGLKPTVGLVSRTHVVPISHSQDTPGPLARSVQDAAAVLTVLAGSDPADPATLEADAHKTDYAAGLSADALRGKRIGVLRPDYVNHPVLAPLYAAALDRLRAAGAVLVEGAAPKTPGLGDDERLVLLTELKADLNAYLASTPATVETRTLADLIAFNAHTPRETLLFGQESFIAAEKTKGLADPAYLDALASSRATARQTLDMLLNDNRLDALVTLTTGPAWREDAVLPNRGWGSMTQLAAVAGYPDLTVPAGQVDGLPVGLMFMGPAWSEARLLQLGYAFQEQGARFAPPTFVRSVEDRPEIRAAFAPAP